MNYPTKLLHASFYNDFSCIGGRCEKTCCGVWKITIDKNTYMKYRKIKDDYLAPKISTYVKRIKDSTIHNYAEFILQEDGHCAFHTEDGLCEIQVKLGYDYLCETCRSYPRHYAMVIDDYLEASLQMSCPEVIRVAVLDPKPITFVVNPQPLKPSDQALKTVSIPRTNGEFGSPAYLIWDIREACIDMMQNRTLSIPERIFALGLLLRKVSALKEEGKLQEISGILKMYVKAAKEGEFQGKLYEFSFDEDVNIAMKLAALQMIMVHAAAETHNHEAFVKVLDAFGQSVKGEPFTLTLDNEEHLEEVQRFIEERAKDLWDGFLAEKSYVLENYFVNLIFNTIIPFTYQTELNIYQHFIMIAHQYAQIKMVLCGSTNEGDTISERLIIDTLIGISITSQHSQELMRLCKRYQSAGTDSLAHISYLLY